MKVEVGQHYRTYQVVNLRDYARLVPDYAAITYTYSRWRRRLAMTDYCMIQPKEHGLRTYYLGRGVMTWNKKWRSPQPPLPGPLQDHWAIDVEDVRHHCPDGFWWFGTGAVREGAHVDLGEPERMGFSSGVDARRQLIAAGEPLSAIAARQS